MIETPDLLTPAELAERLKLTEDQVKRLTAAAKWPHVRFSHKTIRYRAEHVQAILAKYESKAEPIVEKSSFGQTAGSRSRAS